MIQKNSSAENVLPYPIERLRQQILGELDPAGTDVAAKTHIHETLDAQSNNV